MPEITLENGEKQHVDGFISTILFPNGKKYGLRCSIIAVKSITCPKCGANDIELKYGEGKCNFCGTHFTSKFELVEDSAIEKEEDTSE